MSSSSGSSQPAPAALGTTVAEAGGATKGTTCKPAGTGQDTTTPGMAGEGGAPRPGELRQHPWLLTFLDKMAEDSFLCWSACQQLTPKRVFNALASLCWVVLAGFYKPWRLVTHAPGLWAVMVAHLAVQGFMLWVRPISYLQNCLAWSMSGWLLGSIMFPLLTGSTPLQYLTLAQLQGHWFYLKCGVLTSTTTALFHQVPFRYYLVMQLLSVACHVPVMMALCKATYPDAMPECRNKVVAVSAVAYASLGAVIYVGELQLRSLFASRYKDINAANRGGASVPPAARATAPPAAACAEG